MKKISHITLAVAFILFIGLGVKLQASPLWGDLKPGPHAVGFKTIFTYDLMRPALPAQVAVGSAVGRQMQINVWYPARGRARRTVSMHLEDYVYLLSRELDFTSLNEAKQRESIEKFIEQTVELGGEGGTLRSRMSSLLKMSAVASKNSPHAAGRFPLIVYLDAPARHHVLCEYLASHGYIVASTSVKGTFEQEFDVALTGIETIAADIQFVIGMMKTWPTVDRDKVALVGLGITASGALNAQMRNPDVDAVVSLDGGITTPFEDRLLKRAPYYDITAFHVPLLAIYSSHPDVNPVLLDQYRYSTRYYAHFPKMSEFYFLNYGMLEQFVPGIIGKAPGDTKSGFEWASRYMLAFFNTHLKNDAQSAKFLANTPETNLVPPGLIKVDKKVGLKAPPKFFELKAIVRRDGIQSLVALYSKLREADPQPFSQELLVNLFNWASWLRDPEWKERKEISLIRIESFPKSSRAHFTLAQVAMQVNERPLARKHYSEALRLVATDDDPALDGATRRRLEQISREKLESLSK